MYKTSFGAKVYQRFYGLGNLPDNTCKYYWRLMLCLPLLIPVKLLCAFPRLLETIFKIDILTEAREGGFYSKGHWAVVLGINFFVMVLSSMILVWFIDYHSHNPIVSMALAGYLTFGVSTIAFLTLFRKRKKRAQKEKKKWIVTEWIKTIKERNCSKIEWKDKE